MSEDTGIQEISSFNERTRFVQLDYGRIDPVRDTPQAVFLRRCDEIKAAYQETTEYNYLIYAININKWEPACTKVVKLEPGVFSDFIVGRHSSSHLWLKRDPGVSLRHLLVRFYLRPLDLVPVYRVLDLCTEAEFMTVDGHRTCGLVGTGNGMFRVGDYVVFLIWNQDEAWPADPDKAWEGMASKEVPVTGCEAFRSSDDLVAAAQIRPRLLRLEPGRVERLFGTDGDSCFARILGPRYVEDDSPGPEGAKATLRIVAEEGGLDVKVSLFESQLRRGVLIGRYQRCELGGERIVFPDGISRVHLILLEDEGRVFAIDAASTNGSMVSKVAFTTRELRGPVKLDLQDVTIEWSPMEL